MEIFKIVNVKISLLGNGGVGKTSIKRVFTGQPMQRNYSATIGSEFVIKDYNYKTTYGETARLRYLIYDLAGQPRFTSVRRNYIMGSNAGIFVYDVSNRTSLDTLTNWLMEFKSVIRQNVPLVLVANKIDLRESNSASFITTEEGLQVAEKLKEMTGFGARNKFHFTEVSALQNINIDEIFHYIAENIYQDYIAEGKYNVSDARGIRRRL